MKQAPTHPRFLAVVNAFANEKAVHLGGGKGFGSGALKVNGKIFAMMSSDRSFIIKLPRERVDELVSRGDAEYFIFRPPRVCGSALPLKSSHIDGL